MTQHELVIEYLKEKGSILPAKIGGEIYKNTMFGSETSKRCRELRDRGILRSEGEGRFTRFFLTEKPKPIGFYLSESGVKVPIFK